MALGAAIAGAHDSVKELANAAANAVTAAAGCSVATSANELMTQAGTASAAASQSALQLGFLATWAAGNATGDAANALTQVASASGNSRDKSADLTNALNAAKQSWPLAETRARSGTGRSSNHGVGFRNSIACGYRRLGRSSYCPRKYECGNG